jgi:integration host factor subunit beta
MTRADLIYQLALQKGISSAVAERIILTILDSMADALSSGDRIEIRGFCSFDIRKYDGYSGRNPKSGEAVEVKPKKAIYFKVGKELQDRIHNRIQ